VNKPIVKAGNDFWLLASGNGHRHLEKDTIFNFKWLVWVESDAFWALQRTQYLCQIDGTCFELSTLENLKLSGNLNFMQNWQLLLQMTITGRALAVKQLSRLHKFYLGWLPVFVRHLQVKTTKLTLNLGD